MHSETVIPASLTTARRLQGLISLIRPVNTAIAFIGVAAACVIAHASPSAWEHILMAALAGAFAAASGNIINDVFDIDIDRINKPARAIAAGTVSRRAGAVWAAVCAAAALLWSIALGAGAVMIVTGSLLLMYLYSAVLKRIPLVGNLVVGLLTAAAFLFGAFVSGHLQDGIVPAVFAFLFNIAREVLKDIEDMRGDRAGGIRTFPLRAGERAALLLVSAVLIAVIAATFVPAAAGMYHRAYFWVVFFGVDCVLAYVLFAMWNDRSTRNLSRLNTVLKFDMLAGIGAVLTGSILA